VLLQVGFLLFKSFGPTSPASFVIDSETQAQIDVLKVRALEKDTFKIYPFNPNFITDYKGYTLGMSVDEIDRLHTFRKQNKFANSPEEFQMVTEISDSLLKVTSPYFKFPEWTQKKGERPISGSSTNLGVKYSPHPNGSGENILDLNSVTAEDLKSINGIGEKLSARIIKFRDRLGGFLVDEQLSDVYGLEPEVVERAFKKFKVLNPPKIIKININSASAAEIAKLVYLQNHVAQAIVDYRNLNGTIESFDELSKIEDFPADKIARLTLYLSL